MMTPMAEDDDLLENFFGSQKERYVVDHVLREVAADRPLDEILEDPYVTNRLDDRERRALLDHPEISAAVADEVLEDLRARLAP
jgi:hypothetical protein